MKAIIGLVFLVCVGCAGSGEKQEAWKPPPGYGEARSECEYQAELATAGEKLTDLERAQAIRHIINECMRYKGF